MTGGLQLRRQRTQDCKAELQHLTASRTSFTKSVMELKLRLMRRRMSLARPASGVVTQELAKLGVCVGPVWQHVELAKALSPLLGSMGVGGIGKKQSEMYQASGENSIGLLDVSGFVDQVG